MKLFERGLIALVRDLWIAARPFSLSLAFYSTCVPAALAWNREILPGQDPRMGFLRLALVTIAGLAVQGATNLINDHFECGQKGSVGPKKLYRFLSQKRGAFDILVFFAGMACFGLTALIGLYLALTTTKELFIVGAFGLVGGYCYTGEPVVYKRYGLGALLSFVLLGPLMNYGTWLGLGGAASWLPLLIGLPVSLIIPAMMLANEIRDADRDRELGIKTATVRFGRRWGQFVYDALLILAYALIPLSSAFRLIPLTTLAVFASLPLAIRARHRVANRMRDAIPATNLLHLVFGALYIIGILAG